MKPKHATGFSRIILRAVDVIVALYIRRGIRWDKEPFQKVTRAEWRAGWLFVACFPLCASIFITNKAIDSFIDATIAGQHSMIWLYIGVIGFVLLGAFGLLKVGPKVPIFVSISIAVLSWPICLWIGWHFEKFSR